jgi:hypothetical protein
LFYKVLSEAFSSFLHKPPCGTTMATNKNLSHPNAR